MLCGMLLENMIWRIDMLIFSHRKHIMMNIVAILKENINHE